MDAIYERMKDDLEKPDQKLGYSDIQNFFAHKSLLLTGATGFMGKCFVEKVLRDCPDLKRLYLIVRKGKSASPKEKIRKYFQNEIFDRIRSTNPNFEEKVITIEGDLQEDRLALSEADRKILIENVDLIVHNGATVKFDEIVSVALKINVLATKHMLDLAMDCKHVEAFVYISTAYSHCYQKVIEEKFYDPPCDLNMVYDMIAKDESTVGGLEDSTIKKILGKWPNTYTFTKSLAEDLVRQYGEKAPFACGIYRPTIVSAAYKEPTAGWIGNNNGPAYAFLGIMLGAIHVIYYNQKPLDLVPVDYSISSLLAALYDLPTRWKAEKRAVVYNFGSSVESPIGLVDMYYRFTPEYETIGSEKVLWYTFVIICSQKWTFYLCHFFFHFIPAALADLALLCMRKKPRALSIFFFASKHLDKIFYFSNGDWKIHCEEMMRVCDKLSGTDRTIFDFDIRKLDWDDFVSRYARNSRVMILKEPLDNIPVSRKHTLRMKRIHYTVVTVFVMTLFYYFLHYLAYLLNNLFL